MLLEADLRPLKQFFPFYAAFYLLLALVLVIGIFGPNSENVFDYSAYNCRNHDRVWNPSNCNGTQLGKNGTFWYKEFPVMHRFNGFWGLAMKPDIFAGDGSFKQLEFPVLITVSARAASTDPWKIIKGGLNQIDVYCDDGDCLHASVAYQPVIEYPYYSVNLSIEEFPEQRYLGDIFFKLQRFNEAALKLEISVRYIYLAVNVLLLALYVNRVRRIGLPLAFEAKWVIVLLLATILLNNPTRAADVLVDSWFFPLITALSEDIFKCTLLCFWIISLDIYRVERVSQGSYFLFVLGVIGLYGFVDLLFFSWLKIAEYDNVLMQIPLGLLLAYYLMSFLFVGLVVWCIVFLLRSLLKLTQQYPFAVLVRMSFQPSSQTSNVINRTENNNNNNNNSSNIDNTEENNTTAAGGEGSQRASLQVQEGGAIPTQIIKRYLYLFLPTAHCLLSMVLAFCIFTYGPFNSDLDSFLYYHTMFNAYVWLLVVGYWPVKGGDKRVINLAPRPSEISPISFSPHDEI